MGKTGEPMRGTATDFCPANGGTLAQKSANHPKKALTSYSLLVKMTRYQGK
jgi:hypothetical protein